MVTKGKKKNDNALTFDMINEELRYREFDMIKKLIIDIVKDNKSLFNFYIVESFSNGSSEFVKLEEYEQEVDTEYGIDKMLPFLVEVISDQNKETELLMNDLNNIYIKYGVSLDGSEGVETFEIMGHNYLPIIPLTYFDEDERVEYSNELINIIAKAFDGYRPTNTPRRIPRRKKR